MSQEKTQLIVNEYISKLLLAADTPFFSKTTHERLCTCFEHELNKVMNKCFKFLEYIETKHITLRIMNASIPYACSTLLPSDEVFVYSGERDNSYKNRMKQSKAYRNNSHKLLISHNCFMELVCKEASKLEKEFTITKRSLLILQHYMQKHMINLIQISARICPNDKKYLTSDSLSKALDIMCMISNQSLPFIQEDFYASTIRIMLSQLNPSLFISHEAVCQVNNFISYIIHLITEQAKFNAHEFSVNEDITYEAVKTAVSIILPPELEKHALHTGNFVIKRFDLYYERYDETNTMKKSKKILTRSNYAGLQINVRTVQNAMKRIAPDFRISNEAAIFTTATAEYICAKILNQAQEFARTFNNKIITPKHLNLSIERDCELYELCTTYGITFIGGGSKAKKISSLINISFGVASDETRYEDDYHTCEDDPNMTEIANKYQDEDESRCSSRNKTNKYEVVKLVEDLEKEETAKEEDEFITQMLEDEEELKMTKEDEINDKDEDEEEENNKIDIDIDPKIAAYIDQKLASLVITMK